MTIDPRPPDLDGERAEVCIYANRHLWHTKKNTRQSLLACTFFFLHQSSSIVIPLHSHPLFLQYRCLHQEVPIHPHCLQPRDSRPIFTTTTTTTTSSSSSSTPNMNVIWQCNDTWPTKVEQLLPLEEAAAAAVGARGVPLTRTITAGCQVHLARTNSGNRSNDIRSSNTTVMAMEVRQLLQAEGVAATSVASRKVLPSPTSVRLLIC